MARKHPPEDSGPATPSRFEDPSNDEARAGLLPGGRVRTGNRALTLAGLGIFVVIFTAWVRFEGIPLRNEVIAVWILLGLLAISLSDIKGWAKGVLFDWAPLFVVLFTYDLLRGFADQLMPHAHVYPQMRFDEVLFGGTVPTVLLQEAFYHHGDPHWWDYLAWGVYTSHFFVTLTVAAVLWRFAYHRFRRYVYLFVGLTLAGFATYVVLPAVPPWMASQMGVIEPTTRMIGQMWYHVGIDTAGSIFSGGSKYANDVAALPSLHAAYPLLLLLVFWNWRPHTMLRAMLGVYVVAMAVTLVYAAEHYVSDIVMGWAYAITVFALGRIIEHRWQARQLRRAGELVVAEAAARPADPNAHDDEPITVSRSLDDAYVGNARR